MILYVEKYEIYQIYQKIYEIYQKKKKPTARTNEQILQRCRIHGNFSKSGAYLYDSNEKSKTITMKIILFTMASERVKYLKINLTKEMQTLITEN